MRKFLSVFFLFLSISLLADVNISIPTTTQGGTPNLSVPSTGDASFSEIADSTGQYVYCVWQINVVGYAAIQVGISSDYGKNWVNPQSTPSTLGTPYLSINGLDSRYPQISTSENGQYVYVTWETDVNGTGYYQAQVAISSDYGKNWSYPLWTPSDLKTPNLSSSLYDTSNDYVLISNDFSGQYVFATWEALPTIGGNATIQVAISSDYGRTWGYPASTPIGTSSPDISLNSYDSSGISIANSASGQLVYIVWNASGISGKVTQVAISSDYGQNWQYPASTPVSSMQPSSDLSLNAIQISTPQITTSLTGQFVYACWPRWNGANYITQAAISSDYGKNWVNPTTTPVTLPQTTPDLSLNGGDSVDDQIETSQSGQYVYIIWTRVITSAGIQVVISSDYGRNWSIASSTPISPFAPSRNLSSGPDESPQLAASSTGQFVYAVWLKIVPNNVI